jgi:hypothetical protein
MLDEGRRRHERGQDVAAAAMQPPSVSPEVKAIVSMLEVIPLKTSQTTLQAARIRIAQHPKMMKQQPHIYNRAKSAGATE